MDNIQLDWKPTKNKHQISADYCDKNGTRWYAIITSAPPLFHMSTLHRHMEGASLLYDQVEEKYSFRLKTAVKKICEAIEDNRMPNIHGGTSKMARKAREYRG